MLVLILLLVIGTLLVYVSKFNFELVTVNLGWWMFKDVPLFYVICASILVGLGLSYLFYMLQGIINSFTIRSKNKEIKQSEEEVLELTKRVHKLEIEKEKISHDTVATPEDINSL